MKRWASSTKCWRKFDFSSAKDREHRAVVGGFAPEAIVDDARFLEVDIAAQGGRGHNEIDARVDILSRPMVGPCFALRVLEIDRRDAQIFGGGSRHRAECVADRP